MLATLQEVKDYLWITDTSEDTVLTSLLNSSDNIIKSLTWRDFEATNYTEYYNWKWENEFLLNQYPVNTLTSFQYNTGTFSNPVWTDFDEDNYKLEQWGFKIWLNFSLNKWVQNIKVVYDAWYSTIPWDLKLATIQLTAYFFNWRKSDWISSEWVDGASVVYDKKMPKEIDLIIKKYRNVQSF